MKSLIPLLLALGAVDAHAADDGSFEFGVSGGVLFTDPLEVVDTSYTVVPKLGYWFNQTVAVEADLGFLTGQTRIGIPQTFPYTAFTPRVGVLGRVFENEPLQLTLAVGIGAFLKRINDNDKLGLPVEGMDVDFLGAAGPGALLPITETIGLRTDVRFALNLGTENFNNRGDSFLNWEWTGGIVFGIPGFADEDKDGIVDDEDACPTDAEDIDGFEDENGCPDTDNDGDNILDDDDQCSEEAEDLDGFEDKNGCPDPDNDGDDILDADDNCPDEAGVAAFAGCPDTDGDDIMDADDECPTEAGPEASFGCPDGDGDRVPDHRDDCPEEAAPEGVNPMRSDGCVHRVYLTKDALVITETIQFNTGKATIKDASTDLLIDIANALNKYKGVKKLQVEGHTDDRGNDDDNMKLSQERADAVKQWLVEKGNIAAARLDAMGFGETQPVGDNTTADGREQNRRVEFKILEQDVNQRFKKKMKKQQKQGGDE